MENKFFLGCNYWSSRDAIYMWRNWDDSVIEKDFKILSEHGIDLLRVFPLWPDFQPIKKLYGQNMKFVEMGYKDGPLPNTPAGKYGIDEEMMARFDRLVELSEKYGMKIIVGLITGWMSSQMFAPPALEGMNIITDPEAIKWQVRFIKYFVSHYADNKTIIMWDLGNECNNMSIAANADQAWLWANSLADAVKANDPQKRPVLTGLHGCTIDGVWRIKDMGEVCDGLTTHPYTCFVPHCDNDKIHSIRPMLHSVCESLYYRDMSGKPCIIEEIGTIMGVLNGNKNSGDFTKATVYSAWAHDIPAYMWWCNHDMDHLTVTPYRWNLLERELGLITGDGRVKEPLKEMKAFSEFLKDFPYKKLAAPETDGIILVGKTEGPFDNWGYSYNSYCLAKQAGLNMGFSYINDPLPDAKLYILPCITGFEYMNAQSFDDLMEKVKNGATVYMSMDDVYMTGFEKYMGVELITKYQSKANHTVELAGKKLDVFANCAVELSPTTAQVLARDQKGEACFFKNSYGKGTVYVFTYPLESYLHGVANGLDTEDHYEFYKLFAEEKPIHSNYKNVCLTKHGDVFVAINYSDKAYDKPVETADLKFKVLKGDIDHIEPYDTLIFEACK